VWDFLGQLEQTGFCTWVRESTSLFAFPGILLMHTVGMGLVVGINAGIDLRVLGIAPAVPLAPLEKFFPVFWLGFWINAVTGTILLAADATTKLANPDFYVKMVFIALALINLRMQRNSLFRVVHADKRPLTTNDKILALTSLFFWLGAITSGRLLAYVGPVSGLESALR
jgi:hypothetical protein